MLHRLSLNIGSPNDSLKISPTAKEEIDYFLGKKIVKIIEQHIILYKFDKKEWSRVDATSYMNNLGFDKSKRIQKHFDLYWAWKVEIA